jgi:hypothetical protein
MLKIIIVCCFFLFSFNVLSKTSKTAKLNPGNWTGSLQLNSNTSLPFKFSIIKNKKSHSPYTFCIHNGEETIQLQDFTKIGDSIHLTFPVFNSKLVLKIDSRKSLSGSTWRSR